MLTQEDIYSNVHKFACMYCKAHPAAGIEAEDLASEAFMLLLRYNTALFERGVDTPLLHFTAKRYFVYLLRRHITQLDNQQQYADMLHCQARASPQECTLLKTDVVDALRRQRKKGDSAIVRKLAAVLLHPNLYYTWTLAHYMRQRDPTLHSIAKCIGTTPHKLKQSTKMLRKELA